MALANAHGLRERQEAIVQRFRALTAPWPVGTWPRQGPRLSTLTCDGMPFECSVSLDRSGSDGLRYGLEAGDVLSSFPTRLESAQRSMEAALAQLGAEMWLPLGRALFEALYPAPQQIRAGYRFGLWLGFVHRTDGHDRLKAYYNLRPWREALDVGLERALGVFHEVLALETLVAATQEMPPGATPVFLGVDYAVAAPLKLKLYFRFCDEVRPHGLFGVMERLRLESEALERLLVLRSRVDAPLPARTLLVSLGIDAWSPEPSVGIFVDPCEFAASDAAVCERLVGVLHDIHIAPLPYIRSLMCLAGARLPSATIAHHTLLGVGVRAAHTKVNVYMKPPWTGV